MGIVNYGKKFGKTFPDLLRLSKPPRRMSVSCRQLVGSQVKRHSGFKGDPRDFASKKR